MDTRTIELDQNDLDKSIEVLSSAAQALQLMRFERLSYRALVLSVDVAALSVVTGIIGSIAVDEPVPTPADAKWSPSLAWLVWSGISSVFLMSLVVGIVSLVLNIPLFFKVFRERARLKKLGLTSLSRSLWIESRRSRWISRGRGYLLIGGGIVIVGFVALSIGFGLANDSLAFLLLFYAIVVGLLLATRYLQNQRERMDLTANAEELRKAFQSLRQRAGKTGVVSVPTELVEQTAKIESAQIAEERKDAILESVTSRPTGYAIAFDGDAAERATLDVADRIELGDLVAQLSIDGSQLEPQEGMGRNKTESKRVEIDYVIDSASRSIRVTAVRRVREVSDASVSGASHA